MNNIVVTQDSGIDPINEERMIPYQIVRDNKKSYRDVKEIDNKIIIKELKEGHIFKTASPLLMDYREIFTKALEEKNDVIHLALSSEISEGGFNSSFVVANQLNEQYPNKVYLVNTLNGATGGTLIDIYTRNLIEKGLGPREIVQELNDFKEYIKTSFYVPNPAGFIGSGRDKTNLSTKEKVLKDSAKLASVVGIKFRVNISEKGRLYRDNYVRLTAKEKGFINMVKDIVNEDNIEEYDNNIVVIGNVLEKYVNMDEVIDYLEEFNYFDNVIRKDINGVVAAYGSEDLCGISLVKKR